MAGEDHRKNELAYLPASSTPASILDRWEREMSGRSSAGRSWGFMLHYCRRVELTQATSEQFLERFRELAESVKKTDRSGEAAQAEERDRILLWLDEFQPLAERLNYGHLFCEEFQIFVAALKDRLLTPWDRALKAKQLVFFRRGAAYLPLSRTERLAIPDQDLVAAVDRLESLVEQGDRARRQRTQHFDAALARWRDWQSGRSWLDAFHQLECDAIGQREQVEAACTEWQEEWKPIHQNLRSCQTAIQAALRPYATLLSSNGVPEEVSARLTRAQRQTIDLDSALAAANWLRQNWPAPSERLEALFALWDVGMDSSEGQLLALENKGPRR
jgi:hypothetical protein